MALRVFRGASSAVTGATPASLLVPKERLTIALCQLRPKAARDKADWEENLARAVECVRQAVKEGAELVVFPEMYMTSYVAQYESRYLAEPVPGPTSERLANVAKEEGVYIVMGMPTLVRKFPGLVKNSAVVVGPEGVLGEYSKTTLPTFHFGQLGLVTEGNYWTPGLRFPLFDVKGWRVGIAICQDCFLPEVPRIYALKGAHLLLVLSAGPSVAKEIWDMMTRMRALENSFFVAYCNTVGTYGNLSFFGGSRVVSPTGEVIVRGPDDEEALVIGTINVHTLFEARCKLPTLRPGYDLQFYLFEALTKPAEYDNDAR